MKRKKLNMALFSVGQQLLLKRMFRTMAVSARIIKQPCIIVINHSSFYDALVLFELYQQGYLPKNTVVAMSAHGLKTVPLFRGLGVQPISKPIQLSEYKQLLQLAKTETLALFPQGVEQHQERRPLTLQRGIDTIMTRFPTYALLVVSIYYSFTDSLRGEIACRLTLKTQPISIEQVMTEELEQLKYAVVNNQMKGFVQLW